MNRTICSILAISILCLLVSGFFILAESSERMRNRPAPATSRTQEHVSPPTVLIKKTAGFCCRDGNLTATNRSDCRGVFYTDERKAKAGCTGFCCKDGKLEEMTKDTCIQKVRGKFYSNKRAADNGCEGWCCNNFNVAKKTAKQCNAASGEFFETQEKADRYCNSRKGWCCVKGVSRRLTRTECKRAKGTFAVSSSAALKLCRSIVKANELSVRSKEGIGKKGDISSKKPRSEERGSSPTPQPLPWNGNGPTEPQVMIGGITSFTDSGAAVDLTITDISLFKNSQPLVSPQIAEKFEYRVTVKNIGGRSQSSTSPVAYLQVELTDNPHINYSEWVIAPFSVSLPPLSAGQEHTITGQTLVLPPELTNNPVEPGTYKLDAIINTSAYQLNDESNQQNNHLAKTFEVLESYRPDLVTCFHSWYVKTTGKHSIPIYVKNIGPGASHETTFSFYLESHGFYTFEVPALASGQTYKIPFPKTKFWVIGNLEMMGTVDLGDTVPELDEDNNKRCSTLHKVLGSSYNYEDFFSSCSDSHPCSTPTPVSTGN